MSHGFGAVAINAADQIPGSRDRLGFSLTGVRTLNGPLFLNWAAGNHTMLAAPFLRLEARNVSPTHPWKPQRAWFFYSRVRTVNCPLFESAGIEKPCFLETKSGQVSGQPCQQP
jgi:hypothetical protein